MAYKDDSTTVFPTRDESVGSALERKMLDEAGGANGIRTRFVLDLDGTTTRLRTRSGHPEFRSTKKTADVAKALRGFVRKSFGQVAALFNSITLVTRKNNFKIYGHGYNVLPSRTSVNRTANTGFNWNDVIAFMGKSAYMNGNLASSSGLPKLEIPIDYVSVPIVLAPDLGQAKPYANSQVFAAGRKKISRVVLGATEYAEFSPPNPQAYGEPYYSGQRVSPDGSVLLSRLWWTGTFGWDAPTATWSAKWLLAIPTLSSPYLSFSTGTYPVEMPFTLLTLSSVANLQEISTELAPPAVRGYLGQYTVAGVAYSFGSVSSKTLWPKIIGTYSVPVQMKTTTQIARSIYSGSYSTTVSIGAGLAASVLLTSSFTLDDCDESKGTVVEFVPTHDAVTSGNNKHAFNYTTSGVASTPMTLVPPDETHDAIYGTTGINVGGSQTVGVAEYKKTHQEIEASININGVTLVRVSVTCDATLVGGQQYIAHPVPVSIPANPWTYTEGLSISIEATLREFVGDGSYTLNNTTHYQICAQAIENQSAIMSSVLHYYPGVGGLGDVSQDQYTFTKEGRPQESTASLDWETRDYILFDSEESVFVYVKTEFHGDERIDSTGSDVSATMTVSLHIEARTGNASVVLYTKEIAYPELFTRREIVEGSGIMHIPSPAQRVMFFPMYRHQGNFRGAAYTTASEEISGAAQSCLMCFRLSFVPYGGMDGVIFDSNNSVALVPMNLLEMLYAYVFSTSGGADLYERYQVTSMANYNAIMNSLFSTTWNIEYKNGELSLWADSTTEIFRT